jgi:hypothetical protein
MSRWQKSSFALTTDLGFRIPNMEALLERRGQYVSLDANVA